MKKTKIVGAILSLAVLSGMMFVPESIGLSRQGISTLGVLIALIIALVTEPLELGISCMLAVALMVVFGVYPSVSGALSGYTNHILFFVLVSFGLSEAISTVPLSKRLLIKLVRIFGAKSERVLLALMLCAAVMSSVMSNVATTAVLISVVLDFLKIYSNEEDRKLTAKAYMIGLPLASMLGGMITPAGSPLNMLGIEFLNQAGIRVGFVQWMAIGTPIAVVMIFVTWFLIIKIFKPVPIQEESTWKYLESLNIPKKFSFQEKYVTVIVAAMFTCWVLSSWYPVLTITVVGTIFMTFFFLPKVGGCPGKKYTQCVSWGSYFLIGTMMSLGGAITANGVSEWLVKILFPAEMHLPLIAITFIMAVAVFLLLIPLPIGPALISSLGASFIVLAEQRGISPVLMIMVLVLCAANCFLLPLDTVQLLTYATGTYKMTDMPKVSVWVQLCIAVCVAVWVPVSLGILGYL